MLYEVITQTNRINKITNKTITRVVPANPHSSPTVQKIGKYEVIKEIGKGATCAVYQAYDPFQNRQVAIKHVFPEALVDQDS